MWQLSGCLPVKVGWFFGLCRRAGSGVVKKWHDFFVKDVSGRRTYVRLQTGHYNSCKKWYDFFVEGAHAAAKDLLRRRKVQK